MTWRDRLENLLDIALRIPPLFVMDAILNKQTSVGFWLLFNIKEPPDSWGFSTITFLFDFAGKHHNFSHLIVYFIVNLFFFFFFFQIHSNLNDTFYYYYYKSSRSLFGK